MENKSFKSFIKEPQNIIAIAVSLISICALVVSIKQTQIMSEQRALMHEQAKASVWPRLQIGRYKSHDIKDYQIIDYNFSISNAGVGPAMITDVRISFNGKVANKWWQIYQNFNLPDSIKTHRGSVGINNSMIKIGEDLVFFNLSENLPLAEYFYKNEESIKMEVWYKSIYDDKWKLTYEKGKTIHEEVDKDFSLPEEEQFEN